MIDKTARETQALKDARQDFAEALTALGLMAPFFDRSAAEIDRLIEAARHRLRREHAAPGGPARTHGHDLRRPYSILRSAR